MSHLSSHGPCPCSPAPALLVSALLPCLGALGCYFSSSSALEAYPHLLPQPFFLRAPFPCGLPGALALTRFCLLQMDLPFLEASALRFGLKWEGGVPRWVIPYAVGGGEPCWTVLGSCAGRKLGSAF